MNRIKMKSIDKRLGKSTHHQKWLSVNMTFACWFYSSDDVMSNYLWVIVPVVSPSNLATQFCISGTWSWNPIIHSTCRWKCYQSLNLCYKFYWLIYFVNTLDVLCVLLRGDNSVAAQMYKNCFAFWCWHLILF